MKVFTHEPIVYDYDVKIRLILPPTINELWKDPVFKAMMKRKVILPRNVRHGEPWVVVARRSSEAPGARWGVKNVRKYKEAFERLKTMRKDPQWTDVAIVSRRVLFPPPMTFRWNTGRYDWCARCRRPTLFQEDSPSPLLKQATVLTDADPTRCYYCGARRFLAGQMKPR